MRKPPGGGLAWRCAPSGCTGRDSKGNSEEEASGCSSGALLARLPSIFSADLPSTGAGSCAAALDTGAVAEEEEEGGG